MKKSIVELVGSVMNHKKFGPCEIIEINDLEACKVTSRIVSTNEIKNLILSSQFFDGLQGYIPANVVLAKKPVKVVHREVDYAKHRNHPLVKEIDRREAGLRSAVIRESASNDENEDNQAED